MSQFSDLNLSRDGVKATPRVADETMPGTDNLLLASKVMHDIFINACPGLLGLSPKNIKVLSKLIEAYWFESGPALNIIKGIVKDGILIETIRGIRIIIQEEKIQDIRGIEDYMIAIPTAIGICSPIP